MTFLTPLLSTLLTSFSTYNLYLVSISISNLQKYEDTAKKAAKYSNIAEDQLWKTRYTQGSAAVSVLISTLSSLYTIFTTSSTPSTSKTLILSLLNIAILYVAWNHVGGFWSGKAKVPLPKTGEYNEAIGKTQEVRVNMAYLIGGWVVLGVVGLL